MTHITSKTFDTTYVYTKESGTGVLKSRAPGRRGE